MVLPTAATALSIGGIYDRLPPVAIGLDGAGIGPGKVVSAADLAALVKPRRPVPVDPAVARRRRRQKLKKAARKARRRHA